jgi:hypothetical protein
MLFAHPSIKFFYYSTGCDFFDSNRVKKRAKKGWWISSPLSVEKLCKMVDNIYVGIHQDERCKPQFSLIVNNYGRSISLPLSQRGTSEFHKLIT